MKKKLQPIAWISIVLLASVASFFFSKSISYKNGYRDGVIFADSSSYKRGKTEGYRDGYEYCDSITEDLDRLRTSEMFNLNLIFEELADPKRYIKLSGELTYREAGGVATSKKRYVKALLINSASFARYNELVVVAQFKDKRSAVLSEMNIKLLDISYPRKSLNFEIGEKDVPELAESVELLLESAQGVD